MKIALIGTGLMGFPMAERILQNRYELIVYNRTLEKALPLKEQGAEVAESVEAAIVKSDIIILMLSDYSAIKNLMYSEKVDSILAGKCLIQMGTISPLENLELFEFCQKNECDFLEAPVLGSINEVKQAKLLVLIGASKLNYEKYFPLFKIFGSDIFFLGDVGKASATKLALNQLIVSLTAGFSTSLSYIIKNQIDTNVFMDIVRKSALYAPTFDKKLTNYENQNFDKTNFPLQLMLKDVNLIKDEINRQNVDSELLSAIESIIKRALERGFTDKDYSSLYMGIFEK